MLFNLKKVCKSQQLKFWKIKRTRSGSSRIKWSDLVVKCRKAKKDCFAHSQWQGKIATLYSVSLGLFATLCSLYSPSRVAPVFWSGHSFHIRYRLFTSFPHLYTHSQWQTSPQWREKFQTAWQIDRYPKPSKLDKML